MISERFRIFLSIVLILYFSGLFYSLSKQYLLVKHTLIWFLAGVVMAVLVAFPGLIKSLSRLFGIYSDTNFLFMALFGFVMLILLYLTHVAMRLTETNRRLLQEVALLNKRLADMDAGISVNIESESKEVSTEASQSGS